MGVAGDISLIEAEGVHRCGDPIGRGREPRVEACDPLRLARVHEIDRVDAPVLGQRVDIPSPVG